MSPRPTQRHQLICLRLVALLTNAVSDEYVVNSGWAWKPAADEFIPDVMVYRTTDEAAGAVELDFGVGKVTVDLEALLA